MVYTVKQINRLLEAVDGLQLTLDWAQLVSQGISEKLLEWKGIEATMELVKSPNSKVIVVGNSKNGLPLIYSGEK